MEFGVMEATSTPEAAQLWDSLVAASEDAWFWHTHNNRLFHLCAAQKSDARDLSLFILVDGKPVGLAPMFVQKQDVGEYAGWDASYYGSPLPWPCFISGLAERDAVEDFAFTELERRAREAGAGRIRFRLSPPRPLPDTEHRYANIVLSRHYIDARYPSHFMTIDAAARENVRDRYRRYRKKFLPLYELSVVDGEAIDEALVETYFHLHVKDAGGQFRSRESYTLQANLAKRGEGFYVVARNREKGCIAGMLLVSLHKGAAFDNSVGVDPDYQQHYVSHLMKWTAIETLIARAAESYELGERAILPTVTKLPSSKNYGITHFKEGWARQADKTVYVAEKFLRADFLDAYLKERGQALRAHFQVD